MASNKNISREFPPEPTLRRLPWYLAYVSMLRDHHVEYVSSTGIGKELNVDPSQIAKDLSVLGLKGKTRIGYEVEALERALREFLGFTRSHDAVMIGCGSLGSALIADTGLERFGLNIVAGFDVNADVVDTEIKGIHIYHIDNLSELQKRIKASIAIVAVPVGVAQEVADKAVSAGIPALWNFTPFRILTQPGTVIQNTSIYSHLAVMYNRLNALTNEGSSD
ncbi:MAG: redox-sensing transcriptional repressor Rex [Bacteroides sp.]|nr:redox-sensing transcriptional repressor Rex [Bacteroides sp.]MCM1414231.1 redox-sensing transcriptional repressor Rex [Bacteroides sp.]MCM1472390.1 redox-sensing transcriptional repressor Rex [Bacteroides sp.]